MQAQLPIDYIDLLYCFVLLAIRLFAEGFKINRNQTVHTLQRNTQESLPPPVRW